MAFLSKICSSQSSNTKQMIVEGDTPFLPQEIITDILKRLPVKSLIRFQCVCEHWKNLIKSPSFIADHLHHSTHQNPYLLFQQDVRANPLKLYLLDCEMQVHQVKAPLIGCLNRVSIIGSSNGLLCVETRKSFRSPFSLLLWNPAIREVRQVPRIDFEGYCRLGFGFSAVVNDYKIVIPYAKDDEVDRVEVYSLSTGSWKEIDFGNLKGVRLLYETITINGVIFWYGVKLDTKQEVEEDIYLIVSFDIAIEVFTLIPMPAFGSVSRPWLTMYENKLAVLSLHQIQNYKFSLIDLWVLEESTDASGERWSWTKKHTTGPSPCLVPETIWRNEIVCMPVYEEEEDKGKTVLYLFNLNTNEFKRFACSRFSEYDSIVHYVESLVSVGNIHIEEP